MTNYQSELVNLSQDELYNIAGDCGDESGSPAHIRECMPCQAFDLWTERNEAHEAATKAAHAPDQYRLICRDGGGMVLMYMPTQEVLLTTENVSMETLIRLMEEHA